MLLAEIVSDRRDISWITNLPLLLHVSFLGKHLFNNVYIYIYIYPTFFDMSV